MSEKKQPLIEIDYKSLISEGGETATEIIDESAEHLAAIIVTTLYQDGIDKKTTESDALFDNPVLVAVHALISYLEAASQERLILERHEKEKQDKNQGRLVIAAESIAVSLAKIATHLGGNHD